MRHIENKGQEVAVNSNNSINTLKLKYKLSICSLQEVYLKYV